MADSIKAVVALTEEADREALQGVFPGEPEVQVVGVVEGLAGSTPDPETHANLLVVACDGYSNEALGYIESAVGEHPDRPVVVLCSGPVNGFVRRVFEAGADDIVVLGARNGEAAPSTHDVLFAFQKAVARKSGARAAGSATHGRMICVLGPKGGIGKTLTTANLAVTLAEQGQRVVVVDLDLQFGDVGLSLGLVPERTIYDLATSGGAMDAEKVEAYLATHESGMRVLLAPVRPDQAGAVTVDFLRLLYATLRSSNDYVIVDTPPGFTPEVIASVDSSTHVCMVGMLDSLSLKNTKLGLETLDLMGYDSERVHLVLNRADSHVGITHNDVSAIVGREPNVMVPSHRDIARSVNAGAPIVSTEGRSEAAKAFRALADTYTNGNGSKRQNGSRRNGQSPNGNSKANGKDSKAKKKRQSILLRRKG
jgi:pilus assembly protein CpaE